MSAKKQIRHAFTSACLKRDGYKCAMCGRKADKDKWQEVLDVHHISDRSEMPNGGYVPENGICLCKGDNGLDKLGSCHYAAEEFHMTHGEHWISGYHPNDLYAKIGSSKEKAIEASKRLE